MKLMKRSISMAMFTIFVAVAGNAECDLSDLHGVWKIKAATGVLVGYGLLVVYEQDGKSRYAWTLAGSVSLPDRIESGWIKKAADGRLRLYDDEDRPGFLMDYQHPNCGDSATIVQTDSFRENPPELLLTRHANFANYREGVE